MTSPHTGLWLQQALTVLLLPPVGLMLLALLGAGLAWRRARLGAGLVLCAAAGLLLLATPAVSGALVRSLTRDMAAAPQPETPPGAIIVLGAEVSHGADGTDIGPMTLERLRAAARLHRATGLPVLVTGGPPSAGEVPLARLMAASLRQDFATPVRWVEDRAADTRDNAAFSAAILRADGIGVALVVSHVWHLPRALGAFARQGFGAIAAPIAPAPPLRRELTQLLPRPDRLTDSWYALREALGGLVYALRD